MKHQFRINEYLVDISKNQIIDTHNSADSSAKNIDTHDSADSSAQNIDTHDSADSSAKNIDTHNSDEAAVSNMPPKSLEVLTVLVENAPNVVSVEELMDQVWKDTVVSPNSVQRCIAQLRKAMNDSSKLQKIIKTHAKKGYSIEAKISFVDSPLSPASTANVATTNSLEETTQQIDESSQSNESTVFTQQNESVPQPRSEKSDADLNASTKPTQTELNLSPIKSEAKEHRWVKRLYQLRYFIIAILLTILAISSFRMLPKATRNLEFNTLTPVLVSDAKETNASYTPDGTGIIFHRFDGLCANNIWLRDIKNSVEHQLTLSTGFYGPHQFTPDGNKIAFMAKDTCTNNESADRSDVNNDKHDIHNHKNKNKTPKNKNKTPIIRHCWNLMTLDINKGLSAPVEPEVVVSCNDGELSNPIWLDNGNIAVLKKIQGNWQVVKYMPGAKIEKTLYAPQQLSIYHLGYMRKKQTIYVLAINRLGKHVMTLLDQQGGVTASHEIIRPENLSPFRMIQPFYDPHSEQLAFSTGKNLYSLSLSGKVNKLTQLRYNDLNNYSFSPEGKKLLATEGKVDIDISQTSIEALAKQHQPDFSPLASFNAVHQPYRSIHRTAHVEQDAQFQPNGHLIAFMSDRTGDTQLWLRDNDKLTQLTNFHTDSLFTHFVWSPQGNSLIATVNGQLIEIDLDKSQRLINTPYPVLAVFQWTGSDSLLVQVRIAGEIALAKFSLASKDLTIVQNLPVKWAQISDSAGLVYLDTLNQFWQHTISGPILINKLLAQVGSNRFILQNDDIWSFNNDGRLWNFHIKQQSFELVGHVNSQVAYFSDLKDSTLLLTQIISAKKDIVELTIQEN
ncbi:winged helix-turn-helix domain-containing protein [Thalassotalea fusca]